MPNDISGKQWTLDEYRKMIGGTYSPSLKETIQQNQNERFQAATERAVVRRTIKERAVELMGGCCQKCGYKRSLAALEFHHVRPQDKSFNISAVGWICAGEDDPSKMWLRVQKELEKCVLLCANCHREIEAEKDAKTVAWMTGIFAANSGFVPTLAGSAGACVV